MSILWGSDEDEKFQLTSNIPLKISSIEG